MEQNRKQFLEEVKKHMIAAESKASEDLLFTYKGVLYPSTLCNSETFQKLEGFKTRGDDIMMISYPKCGSNWMIHILNEMIFMSANKPPPPEIPLIEFGTAEYLERRNQQVSPRLLATHLHHDNIPESFFKNKIKKLVIFRNPKDTAVSFFHFQNSNPTLPNCSSWDEFFQMFMNGKVCYGSYFEYMLAWNEHVDDEDVLIITYEELKENPVVILKQIAEFFGFPLTQEQIQQIADNSTFQNMKAKSEETHGQFGQSIFRKGDIGDWKNVLSPAQSQEMDSSFNKYLRGTKLEAKLKYDVYCKA